VPPVRGRSLSWRWADHLAVTIQPRGGRRILQRRPRFRALRRSALVHPGGPHWRTDAWPRRRHRGRFRLHPCRRRNRRRNNRPLLFHAIAARQDKGHLAPIPLESGCTCIDRVQDPATVAFADPQPNDCLRGSVGKDPDASGRANHGTDKAQLRLRGRMRLGRRRRGGDLPRRAAAATAKTAAARGAPKANQAGPPIMDFPSVWPAPIGTALRGGHGFSGSEAAGACGDSAGHGADSQTRSRPNRRYRNSLTRCLRSARSPEPEKPLQGFGDHAVRLRRAQHHYWCETMAGRDGQGMTDAAVPHASAAPRRAPGAADEAPLETFQRWRLRRRACGAFRF
jgi:hypothetical protein